MDTLYLFRQPHMAVNSLTGSESFQKKVQAACEKAKSKDQCCY